MQSGPNSLDLPSSLVHILKVITCWEVAKVKYIRLSGYQVLLFHLSEHMGMKKPQL